MKKLVFCVALAMSMSLVGCSSSSSTSSDTQKEEEKSEAISLATGKYVIGDDLEAGQYVISFDHTGGILSLSSSEENSNDILYKFVDDDLSSSYYVGLEDGEILEVPGKSELTKVDYSTFKKNTTKDLYIGTYVGGEDLPAGEYIFTFDTEEDSDILSLYDDKEDNLIYEFVSSTDANTYFISLPEGRTLVTPLPASVKRIKEIDCENGSPTLQAGFYTIGQDLPAGKFTINCEPDKEEDGILAAYQGGDKNKDTIIYKFIDSDDTDSFYVSLSVGDTLFLPCKCTLDVKEITSKASFNTKGSTKTEKSSTESSTSSTTDDSGVSSDLKSFLDSYESFMDRYVDFMAKYKENPTDAELLSEYADMLSEYSDFVEKYNAYDSNTMSAADAAYYLEVQTRVLQKLASVQ